MYNFVYTFAPCGTKMREDFHVLKMAAHTMTEESFYCLKTLQVELGMFSEDFSRTLAFFRLKVASAVNNFLSEKITSLVSETAFILLRRIFAQAFKFKLFLTIVSHCLLTDIHVTSHFLDEFFWIAPDSFFDSINGLWRPSKLWSFTLRTIFGAIVLLELTNCMVNSWSWGFKKYNFLPSVMQLHVYHLYSIWSLHFLRLLKQSEREKLRLFRFNTGNLLHIFDV